MSVKFHHTIIESHPIYSNIHNSVQISIPHTCCGLRRRWEVGVGVAVRPPR
jgi:hypothetical protein